MISKLQDSTTHNEALVTDETKGLLIGSFGSSVSTQMSKNFGYDSSKTADADIVGNINCFETIHFINEEKSSNDSDLSQSDRSYKCEDSDSMLSKESKK